MHPQGSKDELQLRAPFSGENRPRVPAPWQTQRMVAEKDQDVALGYWLMFPSRALWFMALGE